MNILHSIFFYFLVVISYIVGASFLSLLTIFNRSPQRLFQTTARSWAKFIIMFSGVKIRAQGLENIPNNQPVIFAANHQGAADILLVLARLPVNFRFAIKKELFRLPFFGWYLKKAGYFPVDRTAMLSVNRIVETVVDIIKQGESVLIFPEGTRTRTGELGKFKRGSLLAALKSGTPIVPVAISGSYQILRPGSWLFYPCAVKFSVGRPIKITSENDYDRKVEEVRQAIAALL